MNSVFNEQILADKLSKLNSTQQCIETLSHWCIFHRSKAEVVVTTWEKQFHSSEVVQKVPLLYLANDILQNSKRKGNEFVSEFWKVLPGALKDLIEKGNDHGKNVVNRLVNIWEERRVFGSRAKNIKAVLLGEESPQPLEFSKKRYRSVKIVKRDSRSIRTKLTIGSTAERIVSAFHLVVSEHHGEDEEMNKCKSVVHRVKKMEKNIDLALANVLQNAAKDPKRKSLSKELEEEETLLKQCIEKLKVVEANRLALVSQLRDALNDQESELENVRTQMQVAQAQTKEAESMRKRLDDENYVADVKPWTVTSPSVDGCKKSAADIAAEVADRLAASTSSQYIMSSVLSTFAAEEGISKTTTVSNSFSVSKPEFMPAPMPANSYQTVLLPPQPTLGPNSQPQYHTIPNPHSQQYLQPAGSSSYPYGNVNASIPSLRPPPSYMMSPMVPLTHQQQPPMAPAPSSFSTIPPLQPAGMVFYAHPHHSQ
ncbi:hypothetical protein SSX86_016483 [Deinandra increscens subsp. villosa]|uniref:CID domain-containing protein n=1 Tax=Deinandra increscens subsp. villosa TaxID=3103831 RepID=A0AAP0H033_9ASTR